MDTGKCRIDGEWFCDSAPRIFQAGDPRRWLLVARMLSVKKPKTGLRFEPPAFRSLKDWIGQAVLLSMILKQRMGFAVAIGGALLILSLPMSGDASAGVEASPFQPLLAGLGAVLLLEGLLAWWRPHMHLLLVDSGFFVCIGAWTVYDVAGGAALYWAGLGALQFWLGYTGFRDWRRFRMGAY